MTNYSYSNKNGLLILIVQKRYIYILALYISFIYVHSRYLFFPFKTIYLAARSN